jgi:divalent metal cation (Fe/Co/Zn/Cd) transporter
VAILLVLRTATRDVFRRLMDGVDPAIMDAAERGLLETTGVQAIRNLQLRWLGHTLHAEADLEVDPELTLAQAHQIAHHAEAHLLGRVRRVAGATIHTSPAGQHATNHTTI